MCLKRLVSKIMARKIDPRDFLLNTDYELDKIVFFEDGNLTSSATLAHRLKFIPLVFGVWSTDSNFSSVNPIGWMDSSTEPGYNPVLSVECYATATNVVINVAGNTGNVPVYYRIYAFEPSDSRENAPYTSKRADKFILNTDYNYCKLMKSGVFTEDDQSFAHNLGYIPQAMAWMEREINGEIRIQPLEAASEYTNVGVIVDSTKIQAKRLFFIDKIHWRLYYDEA